MTTDHRTFDDMKERYSSLFSRSSWETLERKGQDIIEAGGEGPYLIDSLGNRYLDCIGSYGVYNLGRKPEEIAEEFRIALAQTDQGNFPMISVEKARLARSLAEFVPGDPECSVFGVTRGETIDAACKIARGFTGKKQLVTVDGGWFGQTGFAMTLSQRDDKYLFGPMIPDVRKMTFGDIQQARRTIGYETAAVIVEVIQTETHCREQSRAYLQEIKALCERHKALLVFDESQTGFGRTGKRFAFSHHGVVPDILVVGEALGAGFFPIAVTMLSQKVNAYMNKHPMIHLSTFGGSDLGCRVANKALEIYERVKPWKNAEEVGNYLLDKLGELVEKNDFIRSVSGMGLLISIETADPYQANEFCKRLRTNGVIAAPGIVANHCVLLRPSLLIMKEHADTIIDAVAKAC